MTKQTVPTGYVAVQPKGANPIRLHLVREDQTGTLCGRYTLDRILPEDHNGVGQSTPVCGICTVVAAQ